MHRRLPLLALFGFACASLALYLAPGAVTQLRLALYNSDLLFPFSLYRALFTPGARPDWVFGGYTPYLELAAGFGLWLLSRSTHITFALYAVFQPAMVAVCMAWLSDRLFGKKRSLRALAITCAALLILAYAGGHFPWLFYLFSWYGHVSTFLMEMLALGSLAVFVAARPAEKKRMVLSLAAICGWTVLSVTSDALFITQFVAPAAALLALLALLRLTSVRKAIYAALALLYATAAGLALYRLPVLWGSDRLNLYGSYMHGSLSQVPFHLRAILESLSATWDGQAWVWLVWAGFYLLCLGLAARLIQTGQRDAMGPTRLRVLTMLLFLPIQLAALLGAAVYTGNTIQRYLLPAVFLPLGLGWPLLAGAAPGWLAHLRSGSWRAAHASHTALYRFAVYAFVLLPAAALLLALVSRPAPPLANLAEYYPDPAPCLDQHAAQLGLHRGMAHYWQARWLALLSKSGQELVQISPDLQPFRILNNSDGYDQPVDYLVIDHAALPGLEFDRSVVFQRFGEPSQVFTCGTSEFLVYNQPVQAFR